MSKPMGSHFGVGAPPILVYFSGDLEFAGGTGFLPMARWEQVVLKLELVFAESASAKRATVTHSLSSNRLYAI